MIKEKEITIIEKDYLNDLKQIKETIRKNQNKAMVVVNSAMIITYYEIGTIINQRKVWGNKYIERLSNDLKEYGKGYSYFIRILFTIIILLQLLGLNLEL